MIATVLLLIIVSFLPAPEDPFLLAVYNLRSGLSCMLLCLVGVVRACVKAKGALPLKMVLRELDKETLLLLFGLFMVIEGIRSAGIIDAAAGIFYGRQPLPALYPHRGGVGAAQRVY